MSNITPNQPSKYDPILTMTTLQPLLNAFNAPKSNPVLHYTAASQLKATWEQTCRNSIDIFMFRTQCRKCLNNPEFTLANNRYVHHRLAKVDTSIVRKMLEEEMQDFSVEKLTQAKLDEWKQRFIDIEKVILGPERNQDACDGLADGTFPKWLGNKLAISKST